MKLDPKMIEELRKRLPPEAQDIIDEVEAEYMSDEEAPDATEDLSDEDPTMPEEEMVEEEEMSEMTQGEGEEEADLEEEDFEVPAFFRKKK